MADLDSNKIIARREFFRDAMRKVALVSLGMLAVVFARRPLARLRSEVCINEGICSHCPVFGGCGLPQARSAKLSKEPE
jgi:hypothetical protein